MKLPPRTTFIGAAWYRNAMRHRVERADADCSFTVVVQVVAVAVTSCVQVGVQRWFIDSVPTLCDEDQHAKLSCPAAHTMHGASIIWCALDWSDGLAAKSMGCRLTLAAAGV